MTEPLGDIIALWDAHSAKPERRPTPPPAVPGSGGGTNDAYLAATYTGELDAVRTAVYGTHNIRLYVASRRLGELVHHGAWSRGQAETALYDAAATVSAGDVGGGWIERTINSGWEDGIADPKDIPAPRTQPRAVAPVENPVVTDDLWARPTLAHIRQFAQARRCAPLAVLAVAIARALATVPPHVVLPPYVGSYGALNTFVAVVGPSGSGKGSAERCAEDAIDMGHIRVAPTGSGEGIAALFTKREKGKNVDAEERSALVSVAEVSTLTALKSRQGATILGELCKAWSGEQLGFQNADPERTRIVLKHTYRLCAVVGVQPTKANGLLDEADQGVPQRFLWVSSLDHGAPDAPPAEPSPISLDVSTSRFYSVYDKLVFRMPDVVREIVDTNRLSRLRGDGEPLDGHSLQTRMKIAAGLAVLDERIAANEDDWRLAGVLMDVSDQIRTHAIEQLRRAADQANEARGRSEGVRQSAAAETVAKTAVQRIAPKVRRRLVDAGGAMSLGDSRRRLASRDRDYFDDVLEALMAAGDIEIKDAETPPMMILRDGR